VRCLLGEDLVAKRDAFITNVDIWTTDQLPDRIFSLAAETAAEMALCESLDLLFHEQTHFNLHVEVTL
jgi:hypothetical protein